jgi:NADPH-dependent curcumin reductase CurA
MPTATREIHLAARPHGLPKASDFRMVETVLPDPGPGEALVRNVVMSVDPYMRGRMNDAPSYAPPWQLDQPAQGGAVGEVILSAVPGLEPGTLVLHNAGWREHALLPQRAFRVLPAGSGLRPSLYLGVLGMTGLTAYVGLLHIAKFRSGDTVFVSGAAGGVGSVAGQLARLRGAKRVIGSAGSAEKVRFLREELGFDAAFDYHDGPVAKLLAAAAPDGIDVFFDNVGGEHLEAALSSFNTYGRAALCGSISAYNATEPPPGPRNHGLVTGKRLTLKGFIVSDHSDLQPEFESVVGPAVRDGQIVVRETVALGLDNAVPAFIGMLTGENTGKTIVELGPAPRPEPAP